MVSTSTTDIKLETAKRYQGFYFAVLKAQHKSGAVSLASHVHLMKENEKLYVVNYILGRRRLQFYDFNEKTFARQFLGIKFIEIDFISISYIDWHYLSSKG